MNIKQTILLLCFIGMVFSDCYMHHPRGSNNRLNSAYNYVQPIDLTGFKLDNNETTSTQNTIEQNNIIETPSGRTLQEHEEYQTIAEKFAPLLGYQNCKVLYGKTSFHVTNRDK